jgi:hypothetical protein
MSTIIPTAAMKKSNLIVSYVLLVLAIFMCTAQLFKGSIPGCIAFGMIAYTYYRLLKLEK